MVYSWSETSRVLELCCASGILEVHEAERGERKCGPRGQGGNLHAEAQIDAKQLLNSCKVEQLLGRRGERDEEMKG